MKIVPVFLSILLLVSCAHQISENPSNTVIQTNANNQTTISSASATAMDSVERIKSVRIGDVTIDSITEMRVCETISYNDKTNEMVKLTVSQANQVVDAINQLKFSDKLERLQSASMTQEPKAWAILYSAVGSLRLVEVKTKDGIQVINLFGQSDTSKEGWLTLVKSVPFSNDSQTELDRNNLDMYVIDYPGSVQVNQLVQQLTGK